MQNPVGGLKCSCAWLLALSYVDGQGQNGKDKEIKFLQGCVCNAIYTFMLMDILRTV